MRTPHPVLSLSAPLALALALSACTPSSDAPAADAAAAPAATVDDAGVETRADATPVEARSGTYVIDPGHTTVLAQWNHLGFSNPSAHFGDVEGVIVYDADDVSASSVEVTIPLSGLNSFTAAFDEHLRNADFFEAARFPEATFRSTSVSSTGPNTLEVTGDLTIKDNTRPVTLDVVLNGAGDHPMAGVPAIGFDATGTLLRSDFGVGAYAPNVSDEVLLRITTEATAEAADEADDA